MSAPFPLPYRTAPDSIEAIRADLDKLLSIPPAVFAECHPVSIAQAQARFARRAMEAAAEHGAELLAALVLPQLVDDGFAPLDPVAIGDAIDLALAALDELDGDPDLEPEPDDEAGGDDELSLGWREAMRQVDLGHATEDAEHTLGAPERGPWSANIAASFYKPANGRQSCRCFANRAWNQVAWAAGANLDGEGEPEPGYDLPEGDDELCGSEHDGCEPEEQEHSLGAPAGDGDQRHWAQGHESDREADPCDGPGAYLTAEQRQAARDRQPEMQALARQARELRWRVPSSYFDPDTVMPIGPGMVLWQPLVTRDGVPVVGVTAG